MSTEGTKGTSSADETQGASQIEAKHTKKKANPDVNYQGSGSEALDKFRTEHPELYKKFMEGLAIEIVNKMKKGQERIKQAWRSKG